MVGWLVVSIRISLESEDVVSTLRPKQDRQLRSKEGEKSLAIRQIEAYHLNR